MGFAISVDTGSIFSDGVLLGDGNRFEWTKVPTTPHDLTVCFMGLIEELAAKVGLTMEGMLRQTDLIRYGTTVGTNCLLQKNGPKLGILVSQGFENNLYCREGPPEGVLGFLWPNMIVGIAEGVDDAGNIVQPLNSEEVKAIIENLVDTGARGIVVSFRNSPLNRSHEEKLKGLIETEYPRHYLGSVPVFSSTAVSSSRDDHLRTNTVIMNAYLHRDMVRHLYKLEDALRRRGYSKPLFVVHNNGGVARVAKTIALDTYNSGPVAGYTGVCELAKELYGMNNFVSIDVGGTSCDIGVGVEGTVIFETQPEVEGVKVARPSVYVSATAGGGGSKARVDESGVIQVGPESAGSLPGPAAFDLGGVEPTLCDAEVVLGYLDPDYYLGGKRKLNKDKAIAALKTFLCAETGLPIEQAALKVVQTAEAFQAEAVGHRISSCGLRAEDLTLFSFGGSGGSRCCSVASRLGVRRVIVFPFSAVASAYGMSAMDIMHVYRREARASLPSASARSLPDEFKQINSLVNDLVARAETDMSGEGFDPASIQFTLELEVRDGAGMVMVKAPAIRLEKKEQLREIVDLYQSQNRRRNSKNGEIIIEGVSLKASCPMPHHRLPEFEPRGTDPGKALKGSRDAYWVDKYVSTKIYQLERLECGNRVAGPAIVEAVDTTYLVPPGWSYTVDKYLNGVLERIS